MSPEPCLSAIFPPISPVARLPRPSTGSLQVRFPSFPGTMSSSDSLPPLPSARCLASGTTRVASLRSDGPDNAHTPSAWGLFSRLPLPGPTGGNGRVSQVPGEPLSVPALLYDSGRPSPPGPSAARCCLRSTGKPRRRQSLISELNHTADICAHPRFTTTVTRVPWGARSRLVATLRRTGLSPAGFDQKVSEYKPNSGHFVPLLQASPGAPRFRFRLRLGAPLRFRCSVQSRSMHGHGDGHGREGGGSCSRSDSRVSDSRAMAVPSQLAGSACAR